MTISVSTLSAVDSEIGWAANASIDMNWVRNNTTDGLTNLGGVLNRTWYQNNSWGANCSNGNCNCNCTTMGISNCISANCNVCQCNTTNCNVGSSTGASYFNCQLAGNVACGNCQSRPYLQGNCNCACSYQCNVVGGWYVNCACACNCTCFPAGSKVLMSDKSWKNIEQVGAGDFVWGVDGPSEVQYLHITTLGDRKLLKFSDNSLFWSEEHCFWVKHKDKQWFWTGGIEKWLREVSLGVVKGLKDNSTLLSCPASEVEFATNKGFEQRQVIEGTASSKLPLYLPITTGTPIIINNYLVAASVNELGYNYSEINWKGLE